VKSSVTDWASASAMLILAVGKVGAAGAFK
jgi:hypothetical protein